MLKIIIVGMALAPWNVLAGGKLRTDEEEEKRRVSGEKGRAIMPGTSWERNEKEKKMSKALEKVAEEVGAKHITSGIYPSNLNNFIVRWLMFDQVAIAYLLQKTPYVFPIVGGRKVEQLMANIEALGITLSKDQIEYLESIEQIDIGFPHWMIVSYYFFFPFFFFQ